MPLPRLPTLKEVFDNPQILLRYPPSVAQAVIDQLQSLDRSLTASASSASTPVEMAIRYPRYRWMDTRHLHYLGEEVASAVDRSGAIIVAMPPRHAKTHTCSIWTPFWYLIQHPEDQVFLVSYEADFARKWGIKVRSLIELHGVEFGLQINPKKAAGDDWELVSGGGMKTVGAGGGISGNPAKLLIVDDPIKNDEEARSEHVRETLWDWWETTVMQRIEPDTTVIVIGTRYHEDDLIGRLIKHSEAGDGHHFDQITLMAKAEANDPIGREVGEGLWTNHALGGGGTWGQEFYDKREAGVSSYTWNAVYQQRPSPPGGNMVDPSWWRFYRPHELPQSFDDELQSWDLSLDAEKKTDSYHAGLVMSRQGARIFLRDAFHKHCQAPEVISAIRGWNEIYRGAKRKLVERSIAGPFLIQTLHAEISGLIPWPPKGVRKGSKEACLNACIPDIQSGNVYLPLNADGTRPRWVQEFIEELRQFPRAPHDDYVDTFSQGMAYLLPGVRTAVGRDHAEALRRKPIETPAAEHTAALHSVLQRIANKKLDGMRRQQRHFDRSVIPFGRISTAPAAGSRRRSGMW